MHYITITGCTDPQKWYADKIEEKFPVLGWAERDGYKTREPDGYINFVATEDAKVVGTPSAGAFVRSEETRRAKLRAAADLRATQLEAGRVGGLRQAAIGRALPPRMAIGSKVKPGQSAAADFGATQNAGPKIELKHLDKSMPLPEFQSDGAAAMDLRVKDSQCVRSGTCVKYSTGIAIHIKDPNMVGLVVPRSSAGTKLDIRLANTIGVLDSDYQGEIILAVRNSGQSVQAIARGDRIAQILFVPIVRPTFDVVDEFSEITRRGEGAFGSTDGE